MSARLELVGYELDTLAADTARSRALDLGVDMTIRQGDFLAEADSLESYSFHAIITNPPYVRTQQLGSEIAKVLADKYGLVGRVDLTHPFVSIAPRLLKDQGILGLLSSNRFLTTRAGANVRSVLDEQLSVVEIYDLGDTKLFAAAVLPAVTIAKRSSEAGSECLYLSAYEVVTSVDDADDAEDLFTFLEAGHEGFVTDGGRRFRIRSGRLEKGTTPSIAWRMVTEHEEDWLQNLLGSSWTTFGDLAKIRVGIKTTADAVFISDRWDEVEPRPESDLLLPLITHESVAPWIMELGTTRVLYPYDLQAVKRTLRDMSLYPKAMAYLESHSDRLKSRTYVVDGGREWFEIWVPQKPALWARPKIVFPDISEEPRFALDESGAVVNGDCYWISLDDLNGDRDLALLMIAVANSDTATRFYDAVCGNKLYSGRRRWITQYVSQLPVPNPRTAAARSLIDFAREQVAAPTHAEASRTWQPQLNLLVEHAFQASTPASAGDRGALF